MANTVTDTNLELSDYLVFDAHDFWKLSCILFFNRMLFLGVKNVLNFSDVSLSLTWGAECNLFPKVLVMMLRCTIVCLRFIISEDALYIVLWGTGGRIPMRPVKFCCDNDRDNDANVHHCVLRCIIEPKFRHVQQIYTWFSLRRG